MNPLDQRLMCRTVAETAMDGRTSWLPTQCSCCCRAIAFGVPKSQELGVEL